MPSNFVLLLAVSGLILYIVSRQLVTHLAERRAMRDARYSAALLREDKNFTIMDRLATQMSGLERVVTALSDNWDANISSDHIYAETLRQALTSLTSALTTFLETNTTSDTAIDGTTRACEAIAAATDGLRTQISAFTALVAAPKTPDYPEDNLLQPASADQAAAVATFIEAIQRGIPEQQALQEMRDAEEKKIMFSAVHVGMDD